MKIIFILPSRERPIAFSQTLGNIIENVVKPDYEIICALDVDDLSMNNDSVKEKLSTYEKVTTYWGYSKNKVEACNCSCDKIPKDADILILVSDDMRFIQKGFDDIIRVDAQKYFKDTDFSLHYPDGSPVQDRVITLPILGYNFFKRFGYIYNPSYSSLWCDLEMYNVSKILGKYKYIHSNIFKHNHMLWTKTPYDELMKRNESFYDSDKEIYFKRLANNFDL